MRTKVGCFKVCLGGSEQRDYFSGKWGWEYKWESGSGGSLF